MMTVVYISLALSLAALLISVFITASVVGAYTAAQILVAAFFTILICGALVAAVAYIWEKLDL